MSFRIFITHTSSDRDVVEAVRLHAEAIGVEAYFYERDPQIGRIVSSKLQGEIKRADALIAVLSDDAKESAYVHQEIGFALALGKPVLPLIGPTSRKPPLAMLDGREYLRLDPVNPTRGTAALVQALHERQSSKTQEQLILLIVLVAFVILLFWSARSGSTR